MEMSDSPRDQNRQDVLYRKGASCELRCLVVHSFGPFTGQSNACLFRRWLCSVQLRRKKYAQDCGLSLCKWFPDMAARVLWCPLLNFLTPICLLSFADKIQRVFNGTEKGFRLFPTSWLIREVLSSSWARSTPPYSLGLVMEVGFLKLLCLASFPTELMFSLETETEQYPHLKQRADPAPMVAFFLLPLPPCNYSTDSTSWRPLFCAVGSLAFAWAEVTLK